MTGNSRGIQQLRSKMEEFSVAQSLLPQRILAEIEFAEGLAKLEGKSTWSKLITKAYEIIAGSLAFGRANKLKQAVKEAETLMAPIGKAAKKYIIHCVGHAHIDMNWMWSWPETVAATNDTFITVLKLMEEFPDFYFTQSQAAVYEIIRQHNPELFEQIKQRVAEGRWEVAAVHWVEGDKNLASGESLTRHLLYTRRYMKEHFGLEPEDVPLDWEPDTFGHAHTIPTIISRGAVKRYYLCRGGLAEKPPVFWWQGPDGRRVLVNLELSWYNDRVGPHSVKAMLSFCEKTYLKDWMLVYGVGDHGGGPTRRDLRMCREMDSWPVFPKFRFATTQKFYDILEANGEKLPVLDGELNFEWRGCYSSASLIKKTNRLGEHCAEQAETAATLAYRALGIAYPQTKLRQAWIDTIFGHFHDILPGTGVAATREYHSGMFQKTAAITGMIKTHSLRSLATAVDMSFAGNVEAGQALLSLGNMAMGAGAGRGTHMGGISSAAQSGGCKRGFVLFNPTAWNRREIIQLSVWDPEEDDVQTKRFVIHSPDGQENPAQRVGQGDYWGHKYVDLAVPVCVPPMGYSAFVIEQAGAIDRIDPAASPRYEAFLAEDIEAGVTSGAGRYQYRDGEHLFTGGGPLTMENEFLEVELDRLTGGIIKLLDKRTGQDLASPDSPLGVLEYVLERPGVISPWIMMSAWVIRDPKKRICPLEVESIQASMAGPHLATYTVKFKLNASSMSVTYALRAGQQQLKISISAMWLERGGPDIGTPTLRMQFPLAVKDAKARYEIPYGSIERDLNNGQEVPALRWVDVAGKISDSNTVAGCALLNDCKYGFSLDGSTLRVTLIRSSYDPDPLPEMGQHEIRLALVPHGKKLSTADLTRLGRGFNHPLQVISTDIHRGPMPAVSKAVVASKPGNVLVTTVKKAEDEEAVIFRLLETAGKRTSATVKLDPEMMGIVAEAVEVDIIERPLKNSTGKVLKTGFSVMLPTNGIASVKVRFAE